MEEEIDYEYTESFERASADLEILQAAYPDEIIVCQQQRQSTREGNNIVDNQVVQHENEEEGNDDDVEQQLPSSFPLIFTLKLTHPHFSHDDNNNNEQSKFYATITMEFPKGYPMNKSLEILSYRCSNVIRKDIIEEVVSSVKQTALEAFDVYGDGSSGSGEECGLSCCAKAIETWTDLLEQQQEEERIRNDTKSKQLQQQQAYEQSMNDDDIQWITSEEILLDRKSAFQAHLCIITSEDMVQRAVDKLILGNSKLQRATHNMFAYRFTETLDNNKTILKHDNDDDGEDGAGSRLAQLLEMRKEDGVLILVSRWYGGIHLGPKRFAHITNVARNLLVESHENGTLTST